jgi:hypothetical protein
MQFEQKFRHNNIETDNFGTFYATYNGDVSTFQGAFLNDFFYYCVDNKMYCCVLTPQVRAALPTFWGTALLTGSAPTDLGVCTLGSSPNYILAQLPTGEIGFLASVCTNTKTSELVFTKQFISALDNSGKPVIHDHLFYSEMSGTWYGFNRGFIYEYKAPSIRGDSLLAVSVGDIRTSFNLGDNWYYMESYHSDGSCHPFWYGESQSRWFYYNEKRLGTLTTQADLTTFGAYIGGSAVLFAVSVVEDGVLALTGIPVSFYENNAAVDVNMIQGGQLSHNTGMTTISEQPNLLLNDTKIFHTETYSYNMKVTLYAY